MSADIATVPSCCPWDEREEFLLLPGDGLMLVDGRGVITYFDHRARALMAREPACQCGDRLDVFWPELAEVLEEHSLAVDGVGPLELPMLCGEQMARVRLFRTDCGVGIVLLVDRLALHKLRDGHLLMHQHILEHVRDAVIVTTSEPVDAPGPLIVYANRAASRQTGYQPAEILGRSPRLFQGPDTDPLARITFREALRHWQPTCQAVLNYRKDGTPFWVDIDLAPLEDRDGWYTFWVSVQRECDAPGPLP